MYSWLFLTFLIQNVYSVQIRLIFHASLNLLSSSVPSVINGTREECICTMLSSPNITAINYFSNNTCQFFSNQSIINAVFSYNIDLHSSFYFLQLPTRADTLACDGGCPNLMGTTVFGGLVWNTTEVLSMLYTPWCVTINSDNSMLTVDANMERVLRIYENATTGVVVAQRNLGSWSVTRRALYDRSLLNLFFMQLGLCAMRKSYNGSFNTTVLFGGSCGSSSTQFNRAANFRMDSIGNFYIADNNNHRVLYWPANATSNVVIAGVTGVLGNDSLHLQNPQDVALNETQGVFYVADTNNHRVMRYTIGSLNGTIVAGGNGADYARNQLNQPIDLCISKKTNAIYIADSQNHRIVRWYVGGSEGTIIAGSSNGTAGSGPFGLNTPVSVSLGNDEKHLYVSDSYNNRIQRFTLN